MLRVTRMFSGTAVLMILAACSGRHDASAASPHAFADTRQLMLAMAEPTSNVIFAAQGETPTDDAGWELVAANALVLAESGVMLTTGPRRVDEADWLKYAGSLIEGATSAASAAQQQNVDNFAIAADEVYAACEGCHLMYLKPRG